MDINDLTIGQAKELALMFEKPSGKRGLVHRFVGEKVIVRSVGAGVHFGTLVSKSGTDVHLKNSRRLWKWICAKGDFLSGVAKYGITDESKVGCEIDLDVLNVCEIIRCTPEAARSIEQVKSHGE